jgi:hypothetical protein
MLVNANGAMEGMTRSPAGAGLLEVCHSLFALREGVDGLKDLLLQAVRQWRVRQ